MAPRVSSQDTPCRSWATCVDGSTLGWTAIDPCRSCAAAGAGGPSTGRARRERLLNADPAQIVTGDAFEKLLSQECAARKDSSISSR
jgi:hypothetical protein